MKIHTILNFSTRARLRPRLGCRGPAGGTSVSKSTSMTLNLKPDSRRGSALTVTLLTCAILGLGLVASLSLIGSQETLIGRSQNWNQAIVVAEGGVEEAMALLNSGVQSPNFAVFPWTSS